MRRPAVILSAVLALAGVMSATGVLTAAPPQGKNDTARLTLKVVSGEEKKPVADAHVVVRFTEPRTLRRDRNVSWETKTNRSGLAVLTGIPVGNIKVQVIARGYQTYGDERELSQAEEEMMILLEPPQGQVSAY